MNDPIPKKGKPLMSAVQSVTDSNFETEVLKAKEPVLVDFYADWCGPCKAMAPILDDVAGQMAGQMKVVKINIDSSPDAPTKYGVRGIPTFMIFRNGQVVESRVGGMAKGQFTDWVKSKA